MCFIKYGSFSVPLGHCDMYVHVRHLSCLLPMPGVQMHLLALYNNTVALGLRITAVGDQGLSACKHALTSGLIFEAVFHHRESVLPLLVKKSY